MAKVLRFMVHADPRTTMRYFGRLDVDDLEDALDFVSDLGAAASGS